MERQKGETRTEIMSSPAPGSFSLFPSPNTSKPPGIRPRGRRSESISRENRAPTPQDFQRPSQDTRATTPRPTTAEASQVTPPRRQNPLGIIQHETPRPQTTETPPRRSSIEKPPLGPDTPSIFPTYNPTLPLNQQPYAPSHTPSRPPRAITSRQSYHHTSSPVLSPQAFSPAEDPSRWGHSRPPPSEPPTAPEPCTLEQLKAFWKVANGWKASASEGRVYALKLDKERDAPVYTLSAAGKPFYKFRLDPTSAGASVSVLRHDPNVGDSRSSSVLSLSTEVKGWHESLSTTLEANQPDGLVALLMPTAASKALHKAGDSGAAYTAERECGRLVWDDDSNSHFLVHPVLATPFCVTVERHVNWNRVEYTLEHHESPRHLAKLTRDGSGGWIEVDTALASKIDSFYIVDVAVTALMLVTSFDEKNIPEEAAPFEAPPVPQLPAPVATAGSIFSKKKPVMEQFEIDVESQDSLKKKKKKRENKEGIDGLPFVLRMPVKMARWAFKSVIWILTVLFGCLRSMFVCCCGCLGSKY